MHVKMKVMTMQTLRIFIAFDLKKTIENISHVQWLDFDIFM